MSPQTAIAPTRRARGRGRRTAFIITVQFLLAPCVTAQTAPLVHAAPDALVYHGNLTADGLRRLQETHRSGEQPARWLEIDSGGGEVNIAMDFGDWVSREQLGIRVSNRCLSACANYVFPAAPVKVIEPQAVVAWHGSAIQTEAASRAAIDAVIERDVLPATNPDEREAVRGRLVAGTLAYLARARARQAEFFRRIGVDERITRIGLDHPAVTDFWFLSVPAMARFGIDRVVAPANYPATDTRRFGSGKVVFIEPAGAGP